MRFFLLAPSSSLPAYLSFRSVLANSAKSANRNTSSFSLTNCLLKNFGHPVGNGVFRSDPRHNTTMAFLSPFEWEYSKSRIAFVERWRNDQHIVLLPMYIVKFRKCRASLLGAAHVNLRPPPHFSKAFKTIHRTSWSSAASYKAKE